MGRRGRPRSKVPQDQIETIIRTEMQERMINAEILDLRQQTDLDLVVDLEKKITRLHSLWRERKSAAYDTRRVGMVFLTGYLPVEYLILWVSPQSGFGNAMTYDYLGLLDTDDLGNLWHFHGSFREDGWTSYGRRPEKITLTEAIEKASKCYLGSSITGAVWEVYSNIKDCVDFFIVRLEAQETPTTNNP